MSRLKDKEAGATENGSTRSSYPVEVLNTALQRLLIKKIPLHHNVERGGAMAVLDNHLYVFINRNSSNDERLLIYRLTDFSTYETDLKIPMNLGDLLSTTIPEMEGFDLSRFRVSGLYVEENLNGEHTLFVSHNRYHHSERCISFNISRTTLDFDNTNVVQMGGWETIFTAHPCINPEEDKLNADDFQGVMSGRYAGHMSGGKMIEYDDENLLVSVGSFHRDGDSFASLTMDSTSAFGKFLLINKATGNSSIYAIGSRNAQGLYKDSAGTIWSVDQGPQGGDELNIVEKGKNFGWPEESYGINYGNRPWSNAQEQGRHDQYSYPIFSWLPSIAPTNIAKIQGDKFSPWRGDLIIGSLTNQSLHRLRIDEDNRIIYNERIPLEHRIRDVAIFPDETISLLTDDGFLLVIDDGGAVFEERSEPVIESRIARLEMFDNLRGGEFYESLNASGPGAESIFMLNCSACHSLEVHDIGPHLANIFNREIGSAEQYNYSEILSARDERWTPELLKSFLLNPEPEFSNSRMRQISLTEAQADSIISYLLKIN